MLRFLGSHWPVRVARVLALAWAGLWIWFGLASGIGEGLDPLGVLIHTAIPGLVFGLFALLAWRREVVGGAALVVAGLLVAAGYPLLMRGWQAWYAGILLTMALPPLISGALLLWHGRSGRAGPA